jgi:hypothetical protein
MRNIGLYITKEGEKYYLDVDNIEDNESFHGIKFQDGDIVKWFWENQKMIGKLRAIGYNLFVIENPKCIS